MKYQKIALKKKENIIKSSTKNKILDELLVLRNLVEEDEIAEFLNPKKSDFISWYAFSDMEKAKKRIFTSIEKKETILIWGDFDCDGVTSTSILYKALLALNAKVIKFIPNRMLHGHGLNSGELLKFISKEKVKLVITVDCGISNVSEVNLLKNFNVDVIITDHHSTDSELPKSFAIINPQVNNALKDNLNMKEIKSLSYNSGSIVAYKLAMALLEEKDDVNLKDELLLIASMGAIADVVPLLGENRAIVKEGLKILNAKKEKAHKGIYKLFYKNIENKEITSEDAAFILAPRINAAGRLKDAEISFEFLTSNNETRLDVLIEELDNYNKIRQSKCTEIYESIGDYLNKNKEETQNPAIILLNPDWHIGVIGIAASKIVEEYDKPCFLMTVDEDNNARCSIRSNDKINVYQILKENENLFLGFGGHKLAGGCSFSLNDTPFEKVKNALLESIKNNLEDEEKKDVLYCDIELKGDDINSDLIQTIDKLEPFGQNNETPLCAMFDVVLDEIIPMGKDKNHLRLSLIKDDKKFQGIIWRHSSIEIAPKTKVDIAFHPKLNVFNGVENVQLEIVDIYSPELKFQKSDFKVYDHRKKTGILGQIAQYLKHDNPDVGIWAKNPKTKEELSSYKDIEANFIDEIKHHRGLMFFDYPSSYEEFLEIISKIKPQKIHFMNHKINENLEDYIKLLSGMLKYASNKMEGKIDIERIAGSLGLSVNFVQISLEIMEDIQSIKIIDKDKIQYLSPIDRNKFRENSLWEILKEEFNNIIEFKKSLLNCEIKDIENLIREKISL